MESGAYVVLQVKVGAIPLIKRTEDICAQVESVGKECPLEAGEIRIVKDVEIPREVPPVSQALVLCGGLGRQLTGHSGHLHG